MPQYSREKMSKHLVRLKSKGQLFQPEILFWWVPWLFSFTIKPCHNPTDLGKYESKMDRLIELDSILSI